MSKNCRKCGIAIESERWLRCQKCGESDPIGAHEDVEARERNPEAVARSQGGWWTRTLTEGELRYMGIDRSAPRSATKFYGAHGATTITEPGKPWFTTDPSAAVNAPNPVHEACRGVLAAMGYEIKIESGTPRAWHKTAKEILYYLTPYVWADDLRDWLCREKGWRVDCGLNVNGDWLVGISYGGESVVGYADAPTYAEALVRAAAKAVKS